MLPVLPGFPWIKARRANDSGTSVSNRMEPSHLEQTQRETPPAEVDAVCRAQAGDAQAFSELVRLYQRRTVSAAYRLLGNLEDASDVAQDAFVRAFRSLGQLENPARFGPWLMRVVSNLALNYRRSRKLRSAASLDDPDFAGGQAALRLADRAGEDGALPVELHAAVSAALEQLPEKQRLALILFSVEGMPQKDVAEVLECSIELVKWNVFQARKKLRESLAEHL